MAKFTVLMTASIFGLDLKENLQRNAEMRKELTRLGLSTVIDCLGRYDGYQEHSFAIPVTEEYMLVTLEQLAADYEQESILVINNNNKKATLVFTGSRKHVPIGKWCKVSGYTVRVRDLDHTYFPEANAFYICEV